ncbi:MAG: CopG family ribbon-helix-helix protein [Alphaproteobacteria bacterium]
MAKGHFSIRIKPQFAERLGALAAALERPKSYVVERALEEFLAREAWQVAAIREGLAAADAGALVSDAEVRAWIDSLGTQREKPRPIVKGHRGVAGSEVGSARRGRS